MGQYDAAVADYDAVLAVDAGKVTSLYGRGTAKRRKGDYASGNADIAAARALRPNVSAEFARYGLMPPLTELTPGGSDSRSQREPLTKGRR
jgi:hypothetical protein